ncbi:MAG: hypothetical protein ACR2PZ_18570 [Pseudomonadales bacterium]
MTHLNHNPSPQIAKAGRRGLMGAAVLAFGLVTPFAANAGHDDRARLSVDVAVTPVSQHLRHVAHRDKYDRYRSDRHDHRYNRKKDRRSRYFVRPYEPLNFKHWWRVERRLQHYTPHLGHLNRYERRQVLGHSYDRYLRDHRRWSRRAERRYVRNHRFSRHAHHSVRSCDDPGHRHDRRYRW